jgi:anaphase-promoting complex subunit 8
MEDVDIYSNMLYVMDKRAKLGKLAHEYAELDRNRAEVCCLIGRLPFSHDLGPGYLTTAR